MRRVRGTTGFVLVVAGLVTGCSSASASDAGTTCGTTRTAAGVPVVIKVAKGDVSCPDALAIENKYAAMIRSGQIKGNGGGAPVTVSGWICQGYPTPELLRTGEASQCHAAGTEILAVLPVPSSVPSGTTSSGPTPTAS